MACPSGNTYRFIATPFHWASVDLCLLHPVRRLKAGRRVTSEGSRKSFHTGIVAGSRTVAETWIRGDGQALPRWEEQKGLRHRPWGPESIRSDGAPHQPPGPGCSWLRASFAFSAYANASPPS